MFRIRRIYDGILPGDGEIITRVQEILRSQFSLLSEDEISGLPEKLRDPVKYRFRSILFVADDLKGNIKGFAFLLYFTDMNFLYLDFISAAKYQTGRGVGGALYERVREEALFFKPLGLFFECLPDDPMLCRDPDVLRQNASRLRFYERYGARPVINTKYEAPLKEGGDNPPYLVYDDLGQGVKLRRSSAKEIVRAILERKYAGVCPGEYVDMVVDSFRDDPVSIRPARYLAEEKFITVKKEIPSDKRIILVINDKQSVHHVRERGYVESPVRIKSLLKHLENTGLFEPIRPKDFPEKHIMAVHDAAYINYFKKICGIIKPEEEVYPYVFPIRNTARPPKELPVRAGYYCIDTFTPITRNAYIAAKRAVDCVLTAAQKVLGGFRLAYALVRPPGHHAERKSFGGFCYFNSAAAGAEYLSVYGKIAMLDLDYHHGNGQQDIFYRRGDVLTISIHGHPRFAYPFFTGFEDEKGEGPGEGYNKNITLPENTDIGRYQEALDKAIAAIRKFSPAFLIVPLGLDTAKGDPTGTWNMRQKDFRDIGMKIGALKLPVLVVQEGGYNTRFLGTNARYFFEGLWAGTYSS
ncbi:MAG: histone deacetylase family protein [Candidatus Omnitrophota bacterium]